MKKSKRFIVLTAILGLLLCCALGFAACEKLEEEHTHRLEHVAAQDATCEKEGNIEYWTCKGCELLFADGNGTKTITEAETVVGKKDHDLTKHGATEAGCETEGNIDYWTCSMCKKFFSDEGKTEIEEGETVIPAGHKLSEVKASEPDCEKAGNRAYYECSVCLKKFADESATDVLEDVTIPALGHAYALRVVVAEGTYMPGSYLTADKLTFTLYCTKGDVEEVTLTEGVVCDLSAPLARGENTFTATYEQGEIKAEGQFTVQAADDSEWKEFTFNTVKDGGFADGFTLTGGGNIENDHIGGVSGALGMQMTFSVKADVATKAGLYLLIGSRMTAYNFNDAFKLTVNGKEVSSEVAMPSYGNDWDNYETVLIAFVDLDAGVNEIVFEVISNNGDWGNNTWGIRVTSESAELTAYNWAEYEFNTVSGGTFAAGVYASGGVTFNSNAGGYLGNLSGQFTMGKRVTFFIMSDKATDAVLYFSINSRAASYNFNDQFKLTVNGGEISSNAAMPTGGDNWESFSYVRIAKISLKEGRNAIVFETVSEDGGIGGNVHGIKLATKEGALTAYVPESDFNDSAWNKTDFAAIKNSAFAEGVTATGGWNYTDYIGNLSGAKGATVTFTVTANSNAKAGLYLAICSRSQGYYFFDEFKLTVNGKEVESFATMPDGGDNWESFTYVKIALVDLTPGANTITFEIINDNGSWGGNISGIRLTTEEAGVIAPQTATASYVAWIRRED